MRDIINQPQADILAVFSQVVEADKSTLLKQSGIPEYLFARTMRDLRERKLIEVYQTGHRRRLLYSITMKGQRALADHIKHKAVMAMALEKVPPARRNMFDFPVYAPPKTAYYRNEGNAHIKSRGISA